MPGWEAIRDTCPQLSPKWITRLSQNCWAIFSAVRRSADIIRWFWNNYLSVAFTVWQFAIGYARVCKIPRSVKCYFSIVPPRMKKLSASGGFTSDHLSRGSAPVPHCGLYPQSPKWEESTFTFDGVFKDTVDKVGRDACRSCHARTGVDLNQPRLEVFRQHEVSTIQFKRRLPQAQRNHVKHNEDCVAEGRLLL